MHVDSRRAVWKVVDISLRKSLLLRKDEAKNEPKRVENAEFIHNLDNKIFKIYLILCI